MNPEKNDYKIFLIQKLALWREKKNLSVALFDFDDTLIKTRKIFIKQIELYVEACIKEMPHLSFDEVLTKLKEINKTVYQTEKVNPQRWKTVAKILGSIYITKNRNIFAEKLNILNEIYIIIPEFYEGAFETITILHKAGFRLGLVTHANKQWTLFKLKSLSLENLFESVTIAHEDKFKDFRDWENAITTFHVSPQQAIVIGDNIKGDIEAARKAGVKSLVWLNVEQWSVYLQQEKPKETIIIDEISKLIPTLLAI